MLLKRGSRGENVKKLQKGLAALGYHPGSADGIFGGATEDAVEDFQEKSKLYSDGKAGNDTIKAFNDAMLAYPGFEVHVIDLGAAGADPVDDPNKLKWVRCPADKFESRGGFTRTTLRSDCAVKYNALYEEVHQYGGIITSAGGKRPLSSGGGKAQSKKSMHYVGLAFDMALPTGMQKPNGQDPYIVCKDESTPRKWVVWCRVLDESAPLAADVPVVTLTGWYMTTHRNSKGKKYTQLHSYEWTGKAINFTKLADKHGFVGIRARKSSMRGGSFSGLEFWHFQCNGLLTKGVSTFGQELLKLYDLATIKSKFKWWDASKDCVFGESWF